MLKEHAAGTHRVVAPEQTLARVAPRQREYGITRCADITGLDCLGIPVYCAIRPSGRMLQLANGKGCRPVDAQVSALMEAVEHFHVERPPRAPRLASLETLLAEGQPFVEPGRLQGFRTEQFLDEHLRVSWAFAEELGSGRRVLVPSSFVYLEEPSLYRFSTNGLASGNAVTEATLHGTYEVVERHALSLLVDDDGVRFEGCEVVDPASIDDPLVATLLQKIAASRCRLTLLHVSLDWAIHTFLAVLTDPSPLDGAARVNMGSGAHLSPAVAACRAINEAAQSRLTFIHGSREDLPLAAYRAAHDPLFDFFDGLRGDLAWSALRDRATADLDDDLGVVLAELRDVGLGEVYRTLLTPPELDLAVVKVAIPGTRLDFPL